MATWKNLDTLASYSKLAELKGHVNIADAMAGEKGAERVVKYSAPMAAGLTYNYAAKQVDETVLDALAQLADELPGERGSPPSLLSPSLEPSPSVGKRRPAAYGRTPFFLPRRRSRKTSGTARALYKTRSLG